MSFRVSAITGWISSASRIVAYEVLSGTGAASKFLEAGGPEYLPRTRNEIAKCGPGTGQVSKNLETSEDPRGALERQRGLIVSLARISWAFEIGKAIRPVVA